MNINLATLPLPVYANTSARAQRRLRIGNLNPDRHAERSFLRVVERLEPDGMPPSSRLATRFSATTAGASPAARRPTAPPPSTSPSTATTRRDWSPPSPTARSRSSAPASVPSWGWTC